MFVCLSIIFLCIDPDSLMRMMVEQWQGQPGPVALMP